MDFRMDKSSWGMLGFMFLTMVYFLVTGAGDGITFSGYLFALLLGLVTVVVLLALSSIPVLIYCYFVKSHTGYRLFHKGSLCVYTHRYSL